MGMESSWLVEQRPWLTIWYRTRQTVRWVLDDPYSSRLAWLFIPLFGVSITLDHISFSEYGDWYSLSYLLLISLPIGIVGGFVVWSVYSWIFWGAGRLIGGQASWKIMHWTMAWAVIPYVAKLLLWYGRAMFFGEETFTLYTPNIDNSPLLLVLYFLFFFLDSLLTLWFYGILMKSVAEAHQFSFWKGAATVLFSLTFLWIVLKYVFGFVYMPL
jgi:hypothetical protein